MQQHVNELPIPNEAAGDARSRELARIWAAKGKLIVVLANGLWDDPAKWGMMLVDFARHVANAYELTTGRKHEEALERLKAGFDAEWSVATDVATGGLQVNEKGGNDERRERQK